MQAHSTRRSGVRIFAATVALALAVIAMWPAQSIAAPQLNWDPAATGASTGGGSGTWNTGSWYNGTSDVGWVTGDDAILGGGTAGTVTLTSGITANNLIFNTAGYTVTGNTLTLSGGTVNMAASSGTIASVIGGSAGLTVTGGGILTLTAGNVYSGITTINQGAISVSADNILGPAPGSVVANQLTLNGGGLKVTGGGFSLSTNRGITLGTSGGTLDDTALSNGNNFNAASIIAGTGSLTLNANGDTSQGGGGVGGNLGLTNAANTFVGNVTINSGVVNYASDGSWGNAANVITIKGGGIVATGNNTINHNIALSNAGNNLIFRTYGGVLETINGNISGAGNVFHTDGGTLALTGSNTFTGNLEEANGNYIALSGTNSFTGATWLNGNGHIVLTSNNATSPVSIVLMYGGTLFNINGKSATINGLTSGSSSDTSGVVNLGSGGTLTVNGNGLPSGLTSGLSNASVYGQLTGTGSITYNNSGAPQGQWDWFNTSNNFVGNITITSGRLRAAINGTDASLGNVNNGIIFNGTPVATLGNGQGNASYQMTSSTPVTFPATRTFTINAGKEGTMYCWGGNTYTILGQVTGSGSIRKEDSGTLQLSNTSNNYGGNTTIVFGTVQLGASQVIPATSVVTVGNISGGSPLLNLNGQNNTIAGLSSGSGTGGLVANNSVGTLPTLTLTLPSGTAQTYGGILENNTGSGGTLALAIGGSGTQTLSGDNTYAGGTTLTGGTLVLAGANDGASRVGSGLFTIGSGATVQSAVDNVLGYDQSTVTPSVAINGGIWDSNTFASSFGTLTMNGGTLARSSNFWYFNQPGLISASSGSPIISGGSMSLRPAGGATMPINVAPGVTLTISSVMENDSGASGINQTGGGTLLLLGANTYTGTTNITAGTLQLGNGGTSGSINGSSILNNSVLAWNRTDPISATTTQLSSNISGSGMLTFSNSGLVIVNGTNTYTGITTIANGAEVSVTNINNAFGPTPASFIANQLTFTGGKEYLVNMPSGWGSASNLTIDANRGIFVGAGATAVFRTGYSGVNVTVNSVISGSGGIAKCDSPTESLILNAANSFSGPTQWDTQQSQAGLIQLGNALALQNSTVIMNATGGGGLTYTGGIGSFTLGGLSGSTNLGTTDLSSVAVALNVGNNNASTAYSGVLSGGGSLVKIGSGQLTLGGSNTYFGGTRVSSGTLQMANAGALGASTGNLTANSGVLDLSGFSPTVAAFSGSNGTVLTSAASASTLTVNGSVAGSTYSGTLVNGAGTLGLTKIGAGSIQFLAGVNSYSGPTNINAGTLVITGTHSGGGAYSVANGATLAGGGFITGSALVTVNSGATVAPGNSAAGSVIGTFSLPNATFNNGSLATFALSNTATSNGGTNSLIAVGGSLALTGTTTINVNKVNSALDNGNYTLFTFGSLTSFTTSSLALAPGVLSARQNASFTYDTTNDLISLNVVGHAANLTWVGDGSANAWNTDTANTIWFDGTGANFFAPGDLVTFDGTSSNTTVSLSGALTPGSVTVTGTSNYLFNGSGGITGVTALNVAGPGSLTLATTGNSYSLGTNVTGGTLALGVSNALPATGTLTLGTTGSAGTFDLAGFNQQVGGMAVGAGATAANQTIGNSNSASVSTLTFSNSTPCSFAGTIQDGLGANGGQVALNVASGLLTLSGSNTYTGSTTVSGGTLQLGSATALYAGATVGNLNATSGALDLAGYNVALGGLSGSGSITNSTTAASTLTFGGNGATASFSGAVTSTAGTISLVKTGSGTQSMSGAVNGHGSANLNAGMLALSGSGITYPGATTISGGTLSVQDTTAFASAIAVGNSGTLNINRTVTGFANRSPIAGNAITGSGVINVNNAAGGIAGGWSTMNGASALNFTGTINVNSGVFATDGGGGVRGSATVNIASGAVLALHSASNGWVIGGLNGSGDVTTAQSGSPTYNLTLGAADASGSYNGVIHGNNSVTTDGTIEAGTLSLTKTGAGTQVLNGANTYTGATTASGGVLQLGPAGSFATGTSLNVSGGTIDLNGHSQAVALIGGQSGAITNSAGGSVTLTVNVGSNVSGNFGGALSNPLGGNMHLVFNFTSNGGTQATQFGFNNAAAVSTFTGDITVNGTGGAIDPNTGTDDTGIVGIATDNALGAATNGITLNNSAAIFNGQTANGGGGWTTNGDPNLSASRTITLGTGLGGAFRVWGGTNFTINSLITGTGGFTKVDGGTLILTNSNNYTASTVIDSGFVSVGNNFALSTGTIVANGGGLDSTNNANVLGNNNPVVLNSDFTFVGSHNLDLGSGGITLNGNRTMTVSAGTLSEEGPIASTGGTSSLAKAGAGTLVLASSSTAVSAVYDNAGTLVVGNNLALGSGSLVFGGGNLDSNNSANTLTNNNPIAINSNFTFLGSNNLNLGNGPVTLNADRTVAVNAGTLTIGGPMSFSGTGGPFSLTKNNAGTLVLTGSSIALNFLSANGGTLVVQGNAGISLTNELDVSANCNYLQSGGSITAGNRLRMFSGAVLVMTGGTDTVNGAGSTFNDSNSAGASTADLSGASVLNFNNTLALATFAGNTTTVHGNATLNANSGLFFGWVGGGTSVVPGSTITLNVQDAAIVNAAGTFNTSNFNNNANAGSTVINLGNGAPSAATLDTVAFTRSDTNAAYSVALNFNGGILKAAGAGSGSLADFLNGVNQAVVQQGGGTINSNGFNITVPEAIVHGGTAATDGGLVKTGAGMLTLGGNNSYNGGTFVQVGTLQLGNTAALGAGALAANGGTLDLNSNAVTVPSFSGASGVITDSSTGAGPTLFTVNQSALTVFGGAFQTGPNGRTVSLLLAGSGGVTLTGADTLAAATAQNSSTLQIAGSLAAGAVSLNAAAQLAGSGAINVGATGLSYNSTAASTFGGAIGGVGGLAVTSGELTLGGNSSYGGATTISGGTLQMGTTNALPYGAAASNVAVNGILDLAGKTTNVNGLSGTGTVDNSSGSGTLVAGNNDATSTFSGVLQNSAGTAAPLGLTKTGAGTLTLAGSNLFTGPTTVQSGVLSLAGGGLAGPAIVTGGTLDASGFAQSIYSVSMGGLGTLNLGLGNVITSAGSDAFAGTLDIVGAIHAGELMSYAGHTGTFAASNLSGAYQLLYGSTELDIVSSGPPTWSAAGSGSWNVGTNWSSGSPPSGVGATAVVGTATNSTVSVTLDTPQTLGTLVFSNTGGNSSAGYSLDAGTAGTGSLTLDNSGAAAQIVVNVGNHAITAPVYLVGGDLTVSASGNSVLTISGSISQDSARNLTLGGDGSGELVLSGTNNLGGSSVTVTVAAGTLVLNDSQAIADGTNLTVGDASFFGGIQPAGAVSSSAPGGIGLTPVPEPGTLVLLAACVGTMLLPCRRRHRRAAFQSQPT